MLVKISGGQRSGLVLGCSAFTPLDGIRLLTNMPWTSTAALPTGFPAQPPGNAGATPQLPAAPLLSRSLMNSWAFLSQHCDRSAPALRRACKGSLHQNALWLLIGSGRRKVALNAAPWWYKVRSSARCAPPVRACVQQERSATQMWSGRAVPLGGTCHTCASGSALLGKQCRDERTMSGREDLSAAGFCRRPPPAQRRFFPGRCVPKASV